MKRSKSGAPSWRELGYFLETEYAELRDVDISHARNERARGGGPPHAKIGRLTVYPIETTLEWIRSKIVTPTPQPTLVNARPRRARAGRRLARKAGPKTAARGRPCQQGAAIAPDPLPSHPPTETEVLP